jgi:rRNA maturation endonuclease Nob1
MEEGRSIGRIEALLEDARDRVKEAEERANKKVEELERKIESMNLRLQEWVPLLTQLEKQEDTKRQVVMASTINLIANVAAWAVTAFVAYAKYRG